MARARRFPKVLATQMCCALALGGSVLLDAFPASAAGNGALAKDILNHPGSGWAALTQSTVEGTVSNLQSLESAAAKVTGMTAVVAGNEWHSRDRRVFEILLSAFVGKPINVTISRQLRAASKLAAENLCEGATTDPPIAIRSITSPPGYLSTCKTVRRKRLEGFVFVRDNVLGVVASTVARAQLLKVSRSEYKDVPPKGFTSTPGTAVPT